MVFVDAEGVSIIFPFEPYDCQVTYMEKVIKCLKENKNGILESPTGTGKTLCLLCSSLAYLEGKKAQLASKRWELTVANEEGRDGLEVLQTDKAKFANDLNDAVGAWQGEIVPPRIIYASRTHSQLTQAVQELKRTAYKHVKVCVLGSREQLCIHPTVSKEENNSTKVHLCRAKVSARTCNFYNNVENSKHMFGAEIMDIEDMVSMGNKLKCCPYYASRELKADADIIFLPYNYLIDPKSRRAHGLELQGNIVIFDEAHNLEQICEDSVSFDWTSSEIAAAIRDLEEVSDRLTALVAEEENNTQPFNLDPDTKSTPDFNLGQVLNLKSMLHRLEKALDAIPINKPEGIPKSGEYLYELFGEADLRFSNKDEHIDVLDKLTQYLTADATSGIFNRKGAGLTKLSDVVKIAFCRDPTNAYTPMNNHQGNVSRHYKVFIKELQKDNKKKKGGWDAEPTSAKTGRVLSYWCFSPGAAMEELKAQGVRSIILTSGTLSPMSSFKTEMGINFEVELENSHVIGREQVWVGVVCRGPDGTELSSAYTTRFKPEYQASLGNAMVNFARVVPDGLLLFFPSYPVMDKCLESWTASNIWNRVEQYKPIFVEPKRKQDFLLAMDNFYQKVHNPTGNGAVFAAVCRGKVSEGLDFSDNNGRAVVILGLPFPPRMDPRVQLKMQHLDEMRRKGGNGLTGQEWYRQQASRAVNQAIGRVIRHKQDYGAILLCDIRFSAREAVAQLPKWVKPYLNVYSSFGQALKEVIVFFKNVESIMPAIKAKAPRVRAEPGCVGAYFEPSVPSRARPKTADLEKSGAVATHVPSLKVREDYAVSLTRLAMQYDGGSLEKQQLPTTNSQSCSQISSLHARTSSNSTSTGGTAGLLGALDALKSRHINFHAPDPKMGTRKKEEKSQENKIRKKIVLKSAGSRKAVSTMNLQTAEQYLIQVKEALSTVSYKYFSETLTAYKAKSDFDSMITCLAEIFTDAPANYHLLRKFHRFMRSAHKDRFDEMCLSLTGESFRTDPSACPSRKRGPDDSTSQSKRTKTAQGNAKTLDKPNSTSKTQSLKSFFSAQSVYLGNNSQSSCTQSKPLSTHTGAPADSLCTQSNSSCAMSGEQKCETKCESWSDLKQTKCADALRERTRDNISVKVEQKVDKNPTTENSTEPPGYESGSKSQKNIGSFVKESETICDQPKPGAAALEITISGLICVRCNQTAQGPLQAHCGHVCCVQCWKEAINESKQCPQCKVKVKRKNLSRVSAEITVSAEH